jgi:hypothetical protein
METKNFNEIIEELFASDNIQFFGFDYNEFINQVEMLREENEDYLEEFDLEYEPELILCKTDADEAIEAKIEEILYFMRQTFTGDLCYLYQGEYSVTEIFDGQRQTYLNTRGITIATFNRKIYAIEEYSDGCGEYEWKIAKYALSEFDIKKIIEDFADETISTFIEMKDDNKKLIPMPTENENYEDSGCLIQNKETEEKNYIKFYSVFTDVEEKPSYYIVNK